MGVRALVRGAFWLLVAVAVLLVLSLDYGKLIA